MNEKTKKILYFGIFDTLKKPHDVAVSPACCKKMEYVAYCIAEATGDCRIVSIAEPKSVKVKYFGSVKSILSEYVSVDFLGGFNSKGLLGILCSKVWNKLYLVWYMLKNIRRDDTVVLYHTPRHIETFYLLKKILRFRLVLEVEEVYDKVSKLLPYHRWMEQKLFAVADSYIFPTEVLDDIVNIKHRPSVIVYGNYLVNDNKTTKYQDERIHIVYSGTFNSRKGGAKAAIDATKFLDGRYHMHITGWGTESETDVVRKLVEETSSKTNCLVSYDGFIEESEFDKYLQRCDIGICTQNPDDILSSFCFPSKILVYMSNGLSVVSSTTEPIQRCKIVDNIALYDNQNGESIAHAIKNVKLKNNNRIELSALHSKAVDSIKTILV